MAVSNEQSRPGLLSQLRYVWVSLYFLALAVVFTWPLVLEMNTAVVGRIGDNIYFVWMIGWIKQAVFELHVNPFDVWFLNYPEGWNMAYTEITPAMLLLALPFSFISPTFAYNAALLLTFVLSGISMFIWVRHLTGRSDAALLAGTLFAFIPYRQAHFLIGHLNLSGTMWLPLYFMGFFDLLVQKTTPEKRRIRWKPILLGGIMLGLTALTSQYYVYMALIVSALVFLVAILLKKAPWRLWSFWRDLLLMGAVAAPLILLAVMPYFSLNTSGGLPDRSVAILRMYSASPTDFLLPSIDHFLWGYWTGSHFNRELWPEATLYLGAVTILLAVLALVKRKEISAQPYLALLLWGSLMAIILAMGTDLNWFGEPVKITVPEFLRGWLPIDSFFAHLPGYYLYKYLPFFAKLRALMRFGLFALVFLCAAAGLGAAWLISRANPRRTVLIAALIFVLIFIDYYPGPYQEFSTVQARLVDTWLAQQAGDGAVIQFPFIKGEDQDQTYNTLVHQKPFVGGFFNAFPPPQYARLMPVMENFPDADSVEAMHELGVRWVLVDGDEYKNIELIRRRSEALGLRYVDTFDDQWVFILERQ